MVLLCCLRYNAELDERVTIDPIFAVKLRDQNISDDQCRWSHIRELSLRCLGSRYEQEVEIAF